MRMTFVELLPEDPKNRVTHVSLYLATYIKQREHEPAIVDIFINQRLPNEFFAASAKRILRTRPEVVGFSTICNSLPSSILITREIKRLDPGVIIVFGGQAVTFDEVELMEKFNEIDVVIRREGEDTLIELLEAYKNGKDLSAIQGITYRQEGRVVRSPERPFIENLDSLPCLDYSILRDIKKYELVSIEAGRGCPFNCTFCSTCKMWDRKFRIKSPERLAKEFKYTQNVFKGRNKLTYMIHDNMLHSREYAQKYLTLIKGNKNPWRCSARLDQLDDKLIDMLKDSGCESICTGMETGSPKKQKEIKKNLSVDKIMEVLSKVTDKGIIVSISIKALGANPSPLGEPFRMGRR